MKRILYILSVIVIILSALVACNNESPKTPAENPATDFEYISDDDIVFIKKYIGTNPNVVIPQEIDGIKVRTILQYAFCENEIIESVVIPDTVTEIRVAAFEKCKSLVSVVLPEGLTKIEPYTFAECTKLSSISFPQSLETLKDSCFEKCKALKYVKIPKTIKEWEDNAFLNSGIETVEFEEGLEIIGDGAFANTPIKQVTMPQSLKKIGNGAFLGCSKLESVKLNEGLVKIERGAFSGRSKLTEIVIPKTVEKVWDRSFNGSPTLKKLKFDGNAPEEFVVESLPKANTGYTVYYHEGAEGFTSPEWCGYKTQIW